MQFVELIELINTPINRVNGFALSPNQEARQERTFTNLITNGGGYNSFGSSGIRTYGLFLHNNVVYTIETEFDTPVRYAVYRNAPPSLDPLQILINLVNDPTKEVSRRSFVFSPNQIFSQDMAFRSVCFSAVDKYKFFGSSGNRSYGYFKYSNNFYIIESEFNTPVKFAVCDPGVENQEYITIDDRLAKRQKYSHNIDISSIPNLTL